MGLDDSRVQAIAPIEAPLADPSCGIATLDGAPPRPDNSVRFPMA